MNIAARWCLCNCICNSVSKRLCSLNLGGADPYSSSLILSTSTSQESLVYSWFSMATGGHCSTTILPLPHQHLHQAKHFTLNSSEKFIEELAPCEKLSLIVDNGRDLFGFCEKRFTTVVAFSVFMTESVKISLAKWFINLQFHIYPLSQLISS